MEKIIYNKLIRDNIPAIIEKTGKKFSFERVSDDKFRKLLLQKLVEEANEVCTCDESDIINELSDIYEVIDSIVEVYNLDKKAILAAQKNKREKRGGFGKHIKLLWVEKTTIPN